jgi:hypothetical protein
MWKTESILLMFLYVGTFDGRADVCADVCVRHL